MLWVRLQKIHNLLTKTNVTLLMTESLDCIPVELNSVLGLHTGLLGELREGPWLQSIWPLVILSPLKQILGSTDEKCYCHVSLFNIMLILFNSGVFFWVKVSFLLFALGRFSCILLHELLCNFVLLTVAQSNI